MSNDELLEASALMVNEATPLDEELAG
jgi:hypothetical protein